jgi:hypothetical protein
MWYGDPAFFCSVLELFMAANLFYFVPAVFPQFLDQVPAVHYPPLIRQIQ